ncbi:MAG: hypothetical protein AB7O32_02820 [Vicinamibacterales bacterium]
MQCPSCANAMTEHRLDAHQGRTVDVDLCAACQAFWFDGYESLQLTPGATLRLFRVIGEQAAARRQPLSDASRCPRCRAALIRTHDMQRNVAFQYFRCPSRHGRLIAYVDFLREKNFVRPLTADQVAELRRHVQTVNCSNCGAPVDVAHRSTCAHCGSPLSILDPAQASALVAQLQAADEASRTIDPLLPLRLEQARREVDAAFARQRESGPDLGTDLVMAGLGALAGWLKSRL